MNLVNIRNSKLLTLLGFSTGERQMNAEQVRSAYYAEWNLRPDWDDAGKWQRLADRLNALLGAAPPADHTACENRIKEMEEDYHNLRRLLRDAEQHSINLRERVLEEAAERIGSCGIYHYDIMEIREDIAKAIRALKPAQPASICTCTSSELDFSCKIHHGSQQPSLLSRKVYKWK
jgi:hypothetical protein